MRPIPVLVLILSTLAVTTAAEERFLVRVADGDESPDSLFRRLGFTVDELTRADEDLLFTVSFEGVPPDVAEDMLRAQSIIHAVELVRELGVTEVQDGEARPESYDVARRHVDRVLVEDLLISRRTGGEPNPWSAAYARQPAVRSLRIPRAHRRFGRGAGVVALIDTGLDPRHPRLRGRLVPGYDFVRNAPGIPSEWDDLDPETAERLDRTTGALLDQSTVAVLDGWQPALLNQSTVAVLDQETSALLSEPEYRAFGHGTMVAGLVHLVAPDARLMPLKAFRSDGSADTATIAEAIYYAVEHGADIINMSFSFQEFSLEVMRALNYATRSGVMAVAAAGNRGSSLLVFPAALSNVTGIAGLDAEGGRSTLSNYGEDLVSLAAPGEELVSTYPGGHYAVGFGTSFSAAVVSGAISLMIGVTEDIRPADAERALAFGRESRGELGYGLLSLEKSLQWLREQGRDGDDGNDN